MTIVKEFHEAFDLVVNDAPRVPNNDTLRLRMRLIREEFKEVMDELQLLLAPRLSISEQQETLVALTKELADLRYVLEGTAVSLGLPIDAAFEEVHRSNMTKLWECNMCYGTGYNPAEELNVCAICAGRGNVVRKDGGGKVIKPPTYETANIAGLVGVVEGSAEEEAA